MRPYLNLYSIIIFVAIFLVGCSSTQEKKTNYEVTIGLSLGPAEGRWDKDRDNLIEHIVANGSHVIVREASDNIDVQKADIQYMIDKDVDAMIIVPVDGKALCEEVSKARSKGIKIIAYDRLVMNCEIDFYISFDNLHVGELQADYLTRIIPKGNYMVLDGPDSDNNSKFIRLGQMNILQPLYVRI